jgi:hypothetical protein
MILVLFYSTKDHAVNIVGYGYDKEAGLNYYLVKNSW